MKLSRVAQVSTDERAPEQLLRASGNMNETQTADPSTAPSTDTGAPTVPEQTHTESGTAAHRATAAIENAAERGFDFGWRHLKRRPYVGVAIATAAGFGIATIAGVGEIAFAAFVGYAAYQLLKKNEPPSQAFKKAAGFEKEIRP